MKIQAFDSPQPKQEEPLRLRLFQEGDRVVLKAVNADGSPVIAGCILTINQNGILLHSHVTDEVKLPKDGREHIVVVNE